MGHFDGNDDLDKLHPQDGKLISSQGYELDYTASKFRGKDREDVRDAKKATHTDSRTDVEDYLKNH